MAANWCADELCAVLLCISECNHSYFGAYHVHCLCQYLRKPVQEAGNQTVKHVRNNMRPSIIPVYHFISLV